MSPPSITLMFFHSFAKMLDRISKGFDKYGDIILLKGFFVPVYLLRNPDDIEEIFRDPLIGQTKVLAAFPRIRAMFPKAIVSQIGGPSWKKMRQKIQAPFTRLASGPFKEVYQREIAKYAESLESQEENQPFDWYAHLYRFLIDLSYQLSFSKKLSDDEIETHARDNFFAESEVKRRFAPIPFFDRKFIRIVVEKKKFMHELIKERQRRPHDSEDLINLLLETSKNSEVSDEEIVDHLYELSQSLRLVGPPLILGLRLLADELDIQQKTREQGDEYIDKVLAEIFRFYPSTWALPRYCEKGKSLKNGVVIKPKSIVAPSVFHTHRNPKIWENPYEFNPERFATLNHTYASLGFGHGVRWCMGQSLALDIMRTFLKEIIGRFEITRREPDFDPRRQFEPDIHPQEPVLFSLRKHFNFSS